jgi:nicotinamidase/pyrazinamidase
MKVELLVIDPQNDFCDPKGSLCVNGADKDMDRLAIMIDKLAPIFDDIHITLDSHNPFDVAHPSYWKDSKGIHPNPFTIITKADVVNGIWMTTLPSLQKRAQEYVTKLEANGRYPLCIWPPHCLIGSWGHNVYPAVFNALKKWEIRPGVIDYVTKGSNPNTEHYSAIKADVPDPADPSTGVNMGLVNILDRVDFLLVAGEASSHCLAHTVRDLISEFGKDDYVKKIIFLKDAASPVTGFENLADQFVTDMTAKGMQVSDTVNVLKMFNI